MFDIGFFVSCPFLTRCLKNDLSVDIFLIILLELMLLLLRDASQLLTIAGVISAGAVKPNVASV
jgi:hypothetical protein